MFLFVFIVNRFIISLCFKIESEIIGFIRGKIKFMFLFFNFIIFLFSFYVGAWYLIGDNLKIL